MKPSVDFDYEGGKRTARQGMFMLLIFFKKIVILCFILFHQRLHPVDVFEDVVVEEGEGPGV